MRSSYGCLLVLIVLGACEMPEEPTDPQQPRKPPGAELLGATRGRTLDIVPRNGVVDESVRG